MQSIIISEVMHEKLKADTALLEALRAQGVENWEGYGQAMDVLFPKITHAPEVVVEETTIPALEDSSEIKYDSEGYRV